ncbi:MAG: alpha-E domain-containing protein [Fuerstiella sp.]
MLSRVASSIYWMARYAERAENLARFMEVTLNFGLDEPDGNIEHWEPLVRATGDEDYFKKRYKEFTSENVLHFLTFDKKYHSSVKTSVTCARENARTVREAISSEAWEQLNTLYHVVMDAARTPGTRDAAFYDDIVQHCYMFTGILDATMTRGTGWHFANAGRLLERADKTSRILDVKYFTLLRHIGDVNTPFDDLLWSAVLRSACGFEMFRKRFHALTVPRIVAFLILDPQFPRAVRFSVEQARDSLAAVAGPVDADQNTALQQLNQLAQQLASTEARTIIDGGMHEFIDSLQTSLNTVGTAIQDTYFAQRSFPSQQQQQQQTA